MFLKTLEMIGFKSFPDRTVLHFQPGMTAIVGPNGCGKSNVSDAIRWVLGEQSAKALRGSKMEDCIFNGTDTRKPLGMAEVSITFADCEDIINADYNEITITRRVFKSGEGQYFINKTPCRLKDVQRTFMDTGIGTTSYSVLEQGRVDRILSSRPEDRRTVFEEASGIMKYKADKKEAIRKLEQTEANLIRLADVIREVKRQIGSLQRQAGKAKRYKAMREELRKLEIYLTKRRAKKFDNEMDSVKTRLLEIQQHRTATQNEIRQIEEDTASIRQSAMHTEREIAECHEKEVEARSSLNHTKEMISVNENRIEEYTTLSQRDKQEIQRAQKEISELEQTLAEAERKLEQATARKTHSEHAADTAAHNLGEHNNRMEKLQHLLKELQGESIELESRLSASQNKRTELESRKHSEAARKERLFAEQAQLQKVLDSYLNRKDKTAQELATAKEESARHDAELSTLKNRLSAALSQTSAIQEETSSLRENLTSAEARREMLEESLQLDMPVAGHTASEANGIMGKLISHISISAGYETALQAALSSWINAVLVKTPETAVSLAQQLKTENKGPARLIAVNGYDTPGSSSNLPFDPLVNHVECPENIKPVMKRLLANVYVINSLADMPADHPAHARFVTVDGLLAHPDGRVFVFAETEETAAVRRKRELEKTAEKITGLSSKLEARRKDLDAASAEQEKLESAVENKRLECEEKRHDLAVRQGEYQVVSSETEQAGERLNTVTWEINSLTGDESSHETEDADSLSEQISELEERRENLSSAIAERTTELHDMQNAQTRLQSDLTEKRIASAHASQQLDMIDNQKTVTEKRIAELQNMAEERTQNVSSYADTVETLRKSITGAQDKLDEFEKAAADNAQKADSLRLNLEKQNSQLEDLENTVSEKRNLLDELRETKGDLDLKYNQASMKKQAGFEKVCGDYNISLDALMSEPDPDWEEEKPSEETAETRTTELRTKLDAMGPVNLIAIEEYEELKERYSFLTKQESDLTEAKEQLLKVIREINKTTSEMFRSTFEQVNANFQKMYKQLFNGGSARLVLVNEEDVLECGIEIIARPPGKRLQNISLLSGGEKTLTAVALLFAIYMIKPSPFCLLDELDAALDETNIGRFIGILKNFLTQSQFVVITHNRKTIATADTIYGVTMPEKGTSRIVSMRFKKHEETPVAQEEAGVKS